MQEATNGNTSTIKMWDKLKSVIINVNKHFNVDVHTYSYIYLEGFKLTTLVRKPNDFGFVFYI